MKLVISFVALVIFSLCSFGSEDRTSRLEGSSEVMFDSAKEGVTGTNRTAWGQERPVAGNNVSEGWRYLHGLFSLNNWVDGSKYSGSISKKDSPTDWYKLPVVYKNGSVNKIPDLWVGDRKLDSEPYSIHAYITNRFGAFHWTATGSSTRMYDGVELDIHMGTGPEYQLNLIPKKDIFESLRRDCEAMKMKLVKEKCWAEENGREIDKMTVGLGVTHLKTFQYYFDDCGFVSATLLWSSLHPDDDALSGLQITIGTQNSSTWLAKGYRAKVSDVGVRQRKSSYSAAGVKQPDIGSRETVISNLYDAIGISFGSRIPADTKVTKGFCEIDLPRAYAGYSSLKLFAPNGSVCRIGLYALINEECALETAKKSYLSSVSELLRLVGDNRSDEEIFSYVTNRTKRSSSLSVYQRLGDFRVEGQFMPLGWSSGGKAGTNRYYTVTIYDKVSETAQLQHGMSDTVGSEAVAVVVDATKPRPDEVTLDKEHQIVSNLYDITHVRLGDVPPEGLSFSRERRASLRRVEIPSSICRECCATNVLKTFRHFKKLNLQTINGRVVRMELVGLIDGAFSSEAVYKEFVDSEADFIRRLGVSGLHSRFRQSSVGRFSWEIGGLRVSGQLLKPSERPVVFDKRQNRLALSDEDWSHELSITVEAVRDLEAAVLTEREEKCSYEAEELARIAESRTAAAGHAIIPHSLVEAAGDGSVDCLKVPCREDVVKNLYGLTGIAIAMPKPAGFGDSDEKDVLKEYRHFTRLNLFCPDYKSVSRVELKANFDGQARGISEGAMCREFIASSIDVLRRLGVGGSDAQLCYSITNRTNCNLGLGRFGQFQCRFGEFALNGRLDGAKRVMSLEIQDFTSEAELIRRMEQTVFPRPTSPTSTGSSGLTRDRRTMRQGVRRLGQTQSDGVRIATNRLEKTGVMRPGLSGESETRSRKDGVIGR